MRLDGYVRVSQVRGREGDSFISPAVQADRLRSWCQATPACGSELLEHTASLARAAQAR